MREPTVPTDSGETVPMSQAPLDDLRAIASGDFTFTPDEDGSDPTIGVAFARALLAERGLTP